MYVYVPVLKKLILVSVAGETSQYFYSSLDGMLGLHKGTPLHPPPPPNIKFAGTHTFIHLGGEEGGTVRVIKSVLAKNTTQ